MMWRVAVSARVGTRCLSTAEFRRVNKVWGSAKEAVADIPNNATM
jgi:hypothetical protein